MEALSEMRARAYLTHEEHTWALVGQERGAAHRRLTYRCRVCGAIYEGTGDGTPHASEMTVTPRRYSTAPAPVDPYAKIRDEEPCMNRAERRRLARMTRYGE